MDTIRHIDRLILFDKVRSDETAALLTELVRSTSTVAGPEKAALEAFYKIQRALLTYMGRGEISGNYLQDHFCRLLAGDENVFTGMAEAGVFKNLKPGVSPQDLKASLSGEAEAILLLAANEIKFISEIYRFDFSRYKKAADEYDLTAIPVSNRENLSHRELIHEAMSQGDSLDAAIMLSRYYHSYGSGVFQVSPALNASGGELVPVRFVDPISMDDLVGCESQKRMLIDNIDILLSGLTANNVLLYGDSGTGKSSAVKALLNMYASRGLKMISVSKDSLSSLPAILDTIAERGMKFIIFIDDLSFEENEHEYKAFKSLIEGRVTPRPKNTIFIVTTNRKNIVKEVWRDREDQDDVRKRDNIQEKRSLADRFGITLIFPSPDKQEYLAIVRSIAERSGLAMPDDELVSEALLWELRHGGRSGRAARQFVDYMAGMRR